MQILIYTKHFKEKDLPFIQTLVDALFACGINTFVYTPLLQEIAGKIDFPGSFAKFDDHRDFRVHRIDAVVSLGGDGTMLQALTIIRDAGVPMLGINLGRMGFLATIAKEKIAETVQKIKRKQFLVEERSLLFLESQPAIFEDTSIALNDFTILKRDTSSMITIHTFINGEYLNTYWADGIVVATPTGSTGYSLSCGGPIIFPDSKNFVITPVAPHNLNARPIVISDDSVISFSVEGRAENFICTLDSRNQLINSHHQLAVRKNHYPALLIRLHDHTFMNTLCEKLAWGSDIRN